MSPRTALLLSILVSFPLLFGCINYKQTLKMNEDGSGEAYIHYWYVATNFTDAEAEPPPSTESEILQEFEKGGVEINQIRVVVRQEKVSEGELVEWTHVYFTVYFDDVSQFAETTIGDVKECKWTETELGYTLTETIAPSIGIAGMTDYFITFAVNMPGKIIDASYPGETDENRVEWVWDSDTYSSLGAEYTMSCTSEK